MALIFSWRAGDNSLDARYSSYGKTGYGYAVGAISVAADAGAIGGKSVDLTNTAAFRSISWDGKNFANGRAFSFNLRIKPNYSGAPAANRAYVQVSAGRATTAGLLVEIRHVVTTGNLVIFVSTDAGVAAVNAVSAGAWSPTSGTWYDIGFAWDGTTTASSLKVYVDSALLGSITPTAALSSSLTRDSWKIISVGMNAAASSPASTVEEFSAWDSVVDFTSNVALESGNGLLNGASRTSYVSDVAGATLTSFDGLNSTDPGIANVKSGTSYFINGTSYTGTYAASGGGSHSASQYCWSN